MGLKKKTSKLRDVAKSKRFEYSPGRAESTAPAEPPQQSSSGMSVNKTLDKARMETLS
jgi:hypothetical protein